MNTYPDFAILLNAYMQERDRSISWLARRLGVNHGTVSRWLSQDTRPADPETVIRIADILSVVRWEERQKLLLAAGYGYMESPKAESSAPATDSGLASRVEEPSTSDSAMNEPDRTPVSPPPYLVPALPPHGVLGRDEMLARLYELMELHNPEAADVPPVALHGMGGIGKTTLAIALGRQQSVMERFPDGVLWTTLGPTPTIRNLLDDWGRVIGENLLGERDAAGCQERLRSALYRRRMLLVIDDVWEVAHGQLFMVAGPHCRTLLTTRESPAAYTLTTRERTLPVDVLSAPAAVDLLSRLAPAVVTADAESAQRLCERLEFLPLALTLAGRLLAQEADVPSRMQRLVGELIERRAARLQLLEVAGRPGLEPGQPASLHAILGMSVSRLEQVEQERFAILSAFGGEPLTWELGAAAYLWECAEEEAEQTMSHFIQRGLVMQREQQYLDCMRCWPTTQRRCWPRWTKALYSYRRACQIGGT